MKEHTVTVSKTIQRQFGTLDVVFERQRPAFQTGSNYITYCKVASSNTSCLEAHAGLFRLLMKGVFDPYVL